MSATDDRTVECGVRLRLPVSDYTALCDRPRGHDGPHRETWRSGTQTYRIEWEDT